MARHPLFQVMLTLQNNESATLDLPGLDVRPEEIGGGAVRFDLSFDLTERFTADGSPDGLDGVLDYSADLFDEATARRINERLLRVLHAVADDPDRSLGAIDVLGPQERRRVLEEWNDTAGELPSATVVELFAAQAARTPDACALLADDRADGGLTELSYAELNGRANRLAHRLIAAGAGPERFVALALPRSTGLVVAMLAVLKTGAGYLPLDPDYPADRIAHMLDDARPVLVLTGDEAVPGTASTPRLVLGPDGTVTADGTGEAAEEAAARWPATDPAD
ncbi:AMP-binding protein, partial [Streptomyces griseus]